MYGFCLKLVYLVHELLHVQVNKIMKIINCVKKQGNSKDA